jgi:hypothetical protein
MKLRLVDQGKQMHLTGILLWTFLRLPRTLALYGVGIGEVGNGAQTPFLDILHPIFPGRTSFSLFGHKLRSEPQLGKRVVIRNLRTSYII